jgi:hypothetical protein
MTVSAVERHVPFDSRAEAELRRISSSGLMSDCRGVSSRLMRSSGKAGLGSISGGAVRGRVRRVRNRVVLVPASFVVEAATGLATDAGPAGPSNGKGMFTSNTTSASCEANK